MEHINTPYVELITEMNSQNPIQHVLQLSNPRLLLMTPQENERKKKKENRILFVSLKQL